MKPATSPRPAETLARWSFRQALWPLLALAVFASVWLAWRVWSAAYPVSEAVGVLGLLVCAAACIACSALLIFDALLFRLMASYRDDLRGGAAVDDLLARMRLKPLPGKTRSLEDRAAGTRRLARRQSLALAGFVASTGLLLVQWL